MQKLISELKRLYLPPTPLSPALLEHRLLGQTSDGVALASADGQTRAMLMAFPKMVDGADGQHWTRLCEVANAMQVELGLPAPAVSISGGAAYGLWLSLDTAVPTALAQQFLGLLHAAFCPGVEHVPHAPAALVALPPCLHPRTGKWAAFIHPGLGASFADEAGLEMAPPFAGQAALLDSLHSITPAQLAHAMQVLNATGIKAPVTERPPAASGLLLKDASLEDIVRHLHSMHIEPTFRHLIRG